MEKLKNEQRYGLHHTPFTLMWMSIPVVSMGIVFAIAQFLTGLRNILPIVDNMMSWFRDDGLLLGWLLGGLVWGITTSIAQAWLIRQRYGFTPRLWHVMTIIGWIIAGGLIFISIKYDYQIRNEHTETYLIFAWITVVPIMQMFALWPHLRKAALLWLLAAIGAGVISIIAYYSAPIYGESFYAIFYGTLAQPFLTAMALLFLMARHRTDNINQEALATE